jgi:hypothetical protein
MKRAKAKKGKSYENDLMGHILETEADDWVKLILPMENKPQLIEVIGDEADVFKEH